MPFRPVGAQLQGGIPQAPFRLGNQGFGPVAAVHLAAQAAIIQGLAGGLGQQLVNFLLAEVGTTLHRDALAATGGAVRGRNLKDAVGIHIKGHLHLGHPAGGGGNTREPKASQRLIALSHLTFPLEHMDLHRRLICLRGAEHIGTPHGDWRITGNQHLHHATDGFQAHREGRHIVEH